MSVGFFPFKANLLIYSGLGSPRNKLTVTTSGKGLNMDLPSPFFKKPGRPLKIRSTLLINDKSKQPMILKISAEKKVEHGVCVAIEQERHHCAAREDSIKCPARRCS